MRIKFYLKRPKAVTETALYALVNYNNNTLKIYTGEAIIPKHWNKKTQSARTSPNFTESPEFNERIAKIKSDINRLFLNYQNTHDNAEPSPAVLKDLITGAMKRPLQQMTFLKYFNDFVVRSEIGDRVDPRTKKSIRAGVAKGYKTTYNHLVNFAQSYRRKVDFDTIDLEFHADFTKYLTSAPRLLSANTIGSNFQRIKAVMAEATERGINTNMGFKSRHFIKQSEEADTIYLNEKELDEMQALKLTDDPRLDNVRDLFLLGAYTGLRFSDFSILQPKNIKDGFIRITQTKTGDPVVIPVHRIVKKIIEKYEGGLPRAISNVKLNAYLKDLAQLMKDSMLANETKTITKGGVKTIKTVQRWKLLTTHAARRSFATNEYKNGTPSLTIMAITGHKTEKAFMKYIRITPDEHAQKIKLLWDKRSRKTKLKAV